jgi:uncharacterized protein (TIGR00299 family) protein
MQAYFDAFSGISGDMTVGALLDLGLPLADLERAIRGLGLDDCELTLTRKDDGAIHAAKFDVRTTAAQPERTFPTVRAILARGSLPPRVRERAVETFRALAEAEAKVHGTTPDHVHFHEVGAVDAIVDIVGAALGIETLAIDAIYVSPLPLGSGTVESAHGTIPVPGPATIELLRGFAVRPGDGEGELVTPTGAAILRGFGAVSGAPPSFVAGRVGYGAGTRRLRDRPNVLRIILDEASRRAERYAADEMLVIETDIDDMSAEVYGHVSELLLALGAADVTLVPTQMKKGRPGVRLHVLARPELRDAIAAAIFAETTTIGLRFHPVGRLKLERRIEEVWTVYGPIAVKIAGGGDQPRTVAPEYESCRAAAERHRVPLRVVYDAARRAAG